MNSYETINDVLVKLFKEIMGIEEVKKGYVKRVRSEKDRRIVLVSLSEKGEKAYNHHRMFHDRMVLAVLEGLDKEETEVLMKVLENLQNFFRSYEDGRGQ